MLKFFYRDIKDQAVLKLREQLSGYQSPQPIRFTDHPPLDYLSESEIDMMDYRSRIPQHRFRPASALDGRLLPSTGTIKSTRYYCLIFVALICSFVYPFFSACLLKLRNYHYLLLFWFILLTYTLFTHLFVFYYLILLTCFLLMLFT